MIVKRVLAWLPLAKFLVIFAALVALPTMAILLWADYGMAKGDARHHRAEKWYLRDVATANFCILPEMMVAEAHKRSWKTELRSSPYGDSLLEDHYPKTVLVYVEPPLPFGLVPWRAFQFGSDGCLAS